MYPYSAGYYNAALPPTPHYASLQQQPRYYYQPTVYARPSPAAKNKKLHHYNAPRSLILNPFIDVDNRGTDQLLVWNVAQPWEQARRISNGHMVELSDRYLAQPATDPPVPNMRIVSNDFDYRLKVKSDPQYGIVTIGHVLQGIQRGLMLDLEEDEWLDKNEDERVLIHENRCSRLQREDANFEIEPQLRRIDALHDKTFFLGLKQVGAPEAYEWQLKLAVPKKNEGKKDKGKAKVSFF
ncbi:hypothetical protein M422DRAFT_785551 [Sphaerobolus stellatus SS14]|uniref:DUF6699 domain-containing protein n=1 Tax=Sphaerobolus stellatus (strain SS14) TaxID=990650 RepID=A0A0C9U8V6_SPHS4|nr:hypothetical protein M422DRAFT_785551 [Sphaerobolus stellatus SS14]